MTQSLTIKRTDIPPVLDGIPDALWSGVEAVSLDEVFIVSTIDPLDCSVTVQTTWDDDFLYVLYEVEDDIYGVDSSAGWQDDSVQIYLDGDNAKGSAYDANDAELYMRRSGKGGVEGTMGIFYREGLTWAVNERSGGYSAEVRIAWNGFPFSPMSDREFGIDFQVNDDDGGNPDAVLKWADPTGTGNQNPSHFGTAILSAEEIIPEDDIIILRTGTAPILDGMIDTVWEQAESWTLEQVYVLTTPLDPVDLAASVRALWDEDYLYLLYLVSDEQYSDDSVEGWRDDSIQLYLDADRTEGQTFDQNDDWIILRRNDTKPAEGDTSKPYVSSISWSVAETADGYVAEVMVPWNTFGQTPLPGLQFGIDFQVNDDDNEDENPDTAIKLFDTVGDGYGNPSRMGGARLSAHSVPSAEDQGPSEFLGYTATNGWISTGNWMGNLYIRYAPYAWSESTGQWLWISEESDGPGGVWLYFY